MFLHVNTTFGCWTRKYRNTLICILTLATLISCAHASPNSDKTLLTSPQIEPGIVTLANEIVLLLRDRNLDELAKYIHPLKGLSFSPYGYISNDHITITKEALVNIWKSNLIMNWGYYDGSGEPINISISDYFNKFLYASDYAAASLIANHNQSNQGNNSRNIQDVFPASTVIEYHFKGFDPKFKGMDWRSLILVFERYKGNRWGLVAIVNDQWTI